MRHIQFDLLENARDSLTQAVNLLAWKDIPTDRARLKHANLRSLRTTRNAIEHYEWNTTEKEAKVIVGNALSFAFFFANEHLGTDLAAEFKQDDTWRSLINEFYDFVRAHSARIEARFREKGEYPSCCDACGELTVPTWDGSCELCGHWQVVDDDGSPDH